MEPKKLLLIIFFNAISSSILLGSHNTDDSPDPEAQPDSPTNISITVQNPIRTHNQTAPSPNYELRNAIAIESIMQNPTFDDHQKKLAIQNLLPPQPQTNPNNNQTTRGQNNFHRTRFTTRRW